MAQQCSEASNLANVEFIERDNTRGSPASLRKSGLLAGHESFSNFKEVQAVGRQNYFTSNELV